MPPKKAKTGGVPLNVTFMNAGLQHIGKKIASYLPGPSESMNRVTDKYSNIEGAQYQYDYAVANPFGRYGGPEYIALEKQNLDNAYTNARQAMEDYKVAHSDMYQWIWDDQAPIRTEIAYHTTLGGLAHISNYDVDVPGLPSFNEIHSKLD